MALKVTRCTVNHGHNICLPSHCACAFVQVQRRHLTHAVDTASQPAYGGLQFVFGLGLTGAGSGSFTPFRRSAGVPSTTDASASLRVHTIIGPSVVVMASPRLTRTYNVTLALSITPGCGVSSVTGASIHCTCSPCAERRHSTFSDPPISISALPTRPPPTIVIACAAHLCQCWMAFCTD